MPACLVHLRPWRDSLSDLSKEKVDRGGIELHRVGVNLNQLTRPRQHDRRHARPRRAARHPGRARSRRALRPRSMIPRGGRGHGFHVDAAFVLQ